MSTNEKSQSTEMQEEPPPASPPTVSIVSVAPSPLHPPLLPSTTIAHQEELRQIWHSTLGAFLDDPTNKHLNMKLSFGALIGESMNGNFRQPLQREARLEISLLLTQSDKEKEDEKNTEILVKQKAERRQQRQEKKQRQRASNRSSWRWSDLSTASSISTSDLSSTSSTRVTKKTKDKSFSPPQSSIANTRELPAGEQHSVRYMGALGRMGALCLIEGSSIEGSSIKGSSIEGSSIKGSSIEGSSIKGSSIEGSSIKGSSIEGSSIKGSSIEGSSIEGAPIEESSILGVDPTIPRPETRANTFKEVASIERISSSQSSNATDRSRSPPSNPTN